MKIIYKLLSIFVALGVLVTAFCVYFLRTADLKAQVIYDGLGRVLSEPPTWAQILITDEKVWAGIGWHLVDVLWFFGGIYLAVWLYSLTGD